MFHQKEIPKKFWTKVANIVVFIQNRIPTQVVQNKLFLKPSLVLNLLQDASIVL